MKLPSNVETALNIEGATTDLGLLLMDKFLQLSLDHSPKGLCFEFGTYKGRSAALIASHLSNKNWLHAVEQADHLEIDRIKAISPRVTWHKSRSEPFCLNTLKEIVGTKKIAFSHHDASHYFDNVKTELSCVVDNMSPYGIIALDDFNDVYSQVRAAYYYLRYNESFPYELLLLGFNKAILVHQDKFDYFEDIVLNWLQDEFENKNDTATELLRTDVNVNSRNFFFRTRPETNPERRYGVNCFGDQFYQPSHSHHKLRKTA